MNMEELRTKSDDELNKILLDLRKSQFNSRFQKTQGTLEDTSQIRKTRRSIARVKTLLNEKGRQIDAQPVKDTKSKGKAAKKAKTSKSSKTKAA